MGGRYLVSGTQLGTLIALCKTDADECNKLLNEITEKQFIAESVTSIESDCKCFVEYVNILKELEELKAENIRLTKKRDKITSAIEKLKNKEK